MIFLWLLRWFLSHELLSLVCEERSMQDWDRLRTNGTASLLSPLFDSLIKIKKSFLKFKPTKFNVKPWICSTLRLSFFSPSTQHWPNRKPTAAIKASNLIPAIPRCVHHSAFSRDANNSFNLLLTPCLFIMSIAGNDIMCSHRGIWAAPWSWLLERCYVDRWTNTLLQWRWYWELMRRQNDNYQSHLQALQ
jgi:hypothetical protein